MTWKIWTLMVGVAAAGTVGAAEESERKGEFRFDGGTGKELWEAVTNHFGLGGWRCSGLDEAELWTVDPMIWPTNGEPEGLLSTVGFVEPGGQVAAFRPHQYRPHLFPSPSPVASPAVRVGGFARWRFHGPGLVFRFAGGPIKSFQRKLEHALGEEIQLEIPSVAQGVWVPACGITNRTSDALGPLFEELNRHADEFVWKPTGEHAAKLEPLDVMEDRRFDLDFPGGTLAEFAKALMAKTGGTKPIIVSPDLAAWPVPELSLRGVSGWEALANGVQHVGDEPSFVSQYATDSRVFVRPIKPWETRPFRMPDVALDDVATAVATAMAMSGMPQPDMKFHEETRILFVRGTESQLKTVAGILAAIGGTAEAPTPGSGAQPDPEPAQGGTGR